MTLPVILDITTNPPNDSVKRARGAQTASVVLETSGFGLLLHADWLVLVSRARFEGALLVHTIKKCMVNSAVGAIHHAQDLRGRTKLITLKACRFDARSDFGEPN